MIAFLLLAALLGGLAYVALGTDVLAVKQVRVTGTREVPVGEVLVAARVPVGTPMARLDRGAVQGRVLADLPGIASVSVQRVWPSTVRLVIRERTAVAAVPQDGHFVLVDRTGVAYREVPAVPAGVAILKVGRPGPEDAATVAGVSVLLSLPPDLRKLLARIDAGSAEQVVLILRDKRQIVWGGAGESATKIVVARLLISRPGKVFDVSSPGLATVR